MCKINKLNTPLSLVEGFGVRLKSVFVIISVLLFAIGHAQDSTIVSPNQFLTVHENNAVNELVKKYEVYNRKRDFGEGYRIQISYTDVRDEVYKSKGDMYAQFPELSSYVEYEQPYYKLRLGDFKTRLEATYYLQQVIILYPGAFIVKDKIKTL
jgi:hypothetical protein